MSISRRPTTRTMQRMVPVVAVAEGTDGFAPDERLSAVTVSRRIGKAGGAAQVKVCIHRDFTLKDAIEAYCGIDRYIIIETSEGSVFEKSLLFMGRIVRPGLSITSGEDHSEESIVLDCEHVCSELKNRVIEDRYVGATPKDAGKPVMIPTAAVFNYRGLPNRASQTAEGTHAGKSIDRPLFASGIDGTNTSAGYWTYADIFLYLIGWYCSDDTRRYPFIDFSDFLSVCAGGSGGGQDVGYYLGQRASEINFDHLNVLDAMDKLCRAAGIEYTYRSAYVNGRPSFVFDGWAPGTGREMALQLQDYDGEVSDQGWPTDDAEETLKKNNINQVRATYDASEVVTAVKITGAPKRVEFTAELVPGWPNDDVLDDADAEEAKKLASRHWGLDQDELASDAWYSQYVAGSGTAAAGLKYGRYWVLNEDGHFDDREVFDVATRLGGDTDKTAQRPRRLLPCLSRDSQGKSLGVYVEVSFNGSSWKPMESGVRVLDDRCGVYLSSGDLSTLTPEGTDDPSIANAWYALLDGSFKVRVTACVELDSRLEAVETITSGTERWLHVQDPNLRYWKRVGSQVQADSVEEYDDTEQAKSMARAILARNAQWQIPSEVTIPWFETDYVVGDLITQIEGRDLPLKMSLGDVESSPIVVGVTWLINEFCTKLVLQDDRLSSDVV